MKRCVMENAFLKIKYLLRVLSTFQFRIIFPILNGKKEVVKVCKFLNIL